MSIVMRDRIYIDDFCEDLNYQGIILFIANVDIENLRARLKKDDVNKLYRLDYALKVDDPSRKYFIYVENCDLQDLSFPVHEYILEEGYHVYVLYEDAAGFYIKTKNLY